MGARISSGKRLKIKKALLRGLFQALQSHKKQKQKRNSEPRGEEQANRFFERLHMWRDDCALKGLRTPHTRLLSVNPMKGRVTYWYLLSKHIHSHKHIYVQTALRARALRT